MRVFSKLTLASVSVLALLASLCYNQKTNVGALRIKRRLKLTTLLFSFRGLWSVCGTLRIYGRWDDTYELGEYCFSLLRDHVSTELFFQLSGNRGACNSG